MTSPFTCITCRVAFKDLEIQRQHYKSDWHRYNLKRKVADLPPVAVDEFQRRVIAQRSKYDQAKEEQNFYCKTCRKNFSTKNQYENHLSSKKHKEKVIKSDVSETEESENMEGKEPIHSKTENLDAIQSSSTENKKCQVEMEIDSDVESVDSDEWMEDTENPIQNNNCLFCNHHSASLMKNIKHMTVEHSFFIPDPEYCIDIKGLLYYLGEKICKGYMCIWCNESGRAFQSAEAARSHMIDKGHCKMLHEGEALAEYAQFYDYSSSYPDIEASDPDAEVEIPELDDSGYQLVLPSGSVVGHRSLMRYYKQNLRPDRPVALSKDNKLRKILSQYKAIGWTETQKETVVRKARDIKYMQRIQAKYSLKLQLKGNKLQRHFRPQVNF